MKAQAAAEEGRSPRYEKQKTQPEKETLCNITEVKLFYRLFKTEEPIRKLKMPADFCIYY